MSKPLGLKVIAWLSIIGGILGMGMMIFGSTFLQQGLEQAKVAISTSQWFYNAIIYVLGVVFGIGLLNVKKWAWFGEIIIQGVSAIWGVISIVMALNKTLKPAEILVMVLGLTICGIIIAYLMRNDIRQLFQISEQK